MKKIVLVLLVLVFAASCAYAECSVCKNLQSKSAVNICCSRIGNGLSNGLLGWSEIFYRPGKTVAEGGNLVVGFFRGIGNAITRTVVGVVEVATFWTPGDSVVKMDDCPLCAYK